MADASEKPHLLCIPYPAQGHVNPMMKLAKLLHSQGFFITFVNTYYNHRRLLKSKAISFSESLPDFRFECIPDGLPPSGSDDNDATQDLPALCVSLANNGLSFFKDLLRKLHDSSASGSPPVSCIVSDAVMTFTLDAAEEIGIPNVLLCPASACGFMAYLHYRHLIQRGIFPLKDPSQISNGYLDTPVDWIPGMKNMRLGDLPSFIRTTDLNDVMFNAAMNEADRAPMASAIVLNTFDELEGPVLEAMESILPPIYTIGPMELLSKQIPNTSLASLGSNLWREESGCLGWLQGRKPQTVVYINFGSITVTTNEQMIEFAWGLANSKHDFLWVIRPDLVRGETAMLPLEFLEETKERSFMTSWCPQEAVLSHPTVGGFLTHCGWNSTIESISAGVPMLCWPFFAEQQTNCRYACAEWGVGMEIDSDVKREEVEGLIRELMGGEKGKEMRKQSKDWEERAAKATQPGGSSYLNLQKLIKEVLIPKLNV